MTTSEIILNAKELIKVCQSIHDSDHAKITGLKARVSSFLSTFAGPKNSFLEQVQDMNYSVAHEAAILKEILLSFIEHLEVGLVAGISPKRQAEIDVVSDILGQAQELLENPKVHPAAPAVLIGATLEEFLRNWIEDKSLSLGGKSANIDNYTKVLRESDLITKQDVKDITSWAGMRNHAAHGEWEKLDNKEQVKIMLAGVNLFMRKYTETKK